MILFNHFQLFQGQLENVQFFISMDWFKGKSSPETIDFPSKQGPGTDEQRPAGLSLHGMAGGLQGDDFSRNSWMNHHYHHSWRILMVIIMVNP
jgi:hypothetical protein